MNVVKQVSLKGITNDCNIGIEPKNFQTISGNIGKYLENFSAQGTMTHKVHPKGFRIREMKDWDSRGFYEKEPAKFLEEDFQIRQFLKEKLKEAGLVRLEIERFPTKLRVIISTSRPGLIIGRRGEGIERIKAVLQKQFSEKKELEIEVKPVKNPWACAAIVAQWIAQRLEKRIPFRRVLKQTLSRIMMYKEVGGAKIQVSGKLDGTRMARREWLKQGKLPRQTLRSDIDYAQEKAFCSYGVVGVKVWIYKVP